jgi:hypothetical protein
VTRVTLSRRYEGILGTRAKEGLNRRKISPEQEVGLVAYIISLTKRGLPPARKMVQNFASYVAKRSFGLG